MTYSIIQLPVATDFFASSAADLKTYREWFASQIPSRITKLTKAVATTSGFERWVPDYTEKSIETLGTWLSTQVETRTRTQQEMKEMIGGDERFADQVKSWELTERTFSLAMDAGMYLGETMRTLFPHIRWAQRLDSKKMADYGQMVLEGFGKMRLNPVRICIGACYGTAHGEPRGLLQPFRYWSKLAEQEQNAPSETTASVKRKSRHKSAKGSP